MQPDTTPRTPGLEAPERIWLQTGCDEEGCEDDLCAWRNADELTWCLDRIYDNDTEYVRADLALLGAAPSGEPEDDYREAFESVMAALNTALDGDSDYSFDPAELVWRLRNQRDEALSGAPAEREGLREAVQEFLDAEDAVDREAERAGGTPGWSSAPCVRRIEAVKQLRALAAAPREQEPERIDMADRALLCERYWCGCERQARWSRCDDHGHLSHDEEPPTQLDHAHLYREISTPEPPAPGETREPEMACFEDTPFGPMLAPRETRERFDCGCITCVCDGADPDQCYGCGAKRCGKPDDQCDWLHSRRAAPTGEAVERLEVANRLDVEADMAESYLPTATGSWRLGLETIIPLHRAAARLLRGERASEGAER